MLAGWLPRWERVSSHLALHACCVFVILCISVVVLFVLCIDV